MATVVHGNSTLTVEQCKLEVTEEVLEEYPRILKHIHLDAVHPTRGAIRSLTALRIDRDAFRGNFFDVLDDESDELPTFATSLFDSFGRLKPELVENDYLKGTGVWGHELDQGLLSTSRMSTCKRR
ncbi:hypothetical protein BN946_scf184392.g9 [Trametes cinnabarina]|uniref:Uncharacterized protein n=1 Tax=Pycnoporus cinnabarinus TaxID=5643 RepID=A0A060SPP0_PYCCI|nr:hypothetical protein BN946_scf184392.g9 [Trametes cinnabarina]